MLVLRDLADSNDRDWISHVSSHTPNDRVPR
jgi:hypothetical protein